VVEDQGFRWIVVPREEVRDVNAETGKRQMYVEKIKPIRHEHLVLISRLREAVEAGGGGKGGGGVSISKVGNNY
jgi:hypothetical protein